MSTTRAEPGWADVLVDYAADIDTAERLIRQLIARGFAEPSEPLLDEMREEARRVLDRLVRDNVTEIKLLQEHLHDGLGQLIYDRTGRRPMILPVVVEV